MQHPKIRKRSQKESRNQNGSPRNQPMSMKQSPGTTGNRIGVERTLAENVNPTSFTNLLNVKASSIQD